MSPVRRTAPQYVEIDGERLPVWIERGQVRVQLPFDIDFVRLARLLRDDGYFYANHPERVDSQGWGPRLDTEGYYPYWVFREGPPGGHGERRPRTVFAFPPQEYVRPGLGSRPERPRRMQKARPPAPHAEVAEELMVPARPVIGPRAIEELRRWVPYLRRAVSDRQGDATMRSNGSG